MPIVSPSAPSAAQGEPAPRHQYRAPGRALQARDRGEGLAQPRTHPSHVQRAAKYARGPLCWYVSRSPVVSSPTLPRQSSSCCDSGSPAGSDFSHCGAPAGRRCHAPWRRADTNGNTRGIDCGSMDTQDTCRPLGSPAYGSSLWLSQLPPLVGVWVHCCQIGCEL